MPDDTDRTTDDSDVPPPGSDAALDAGCTCPVSDNRNGHGSYKGGGYIKTADCPLHGFPMPDDEDDAESDA